MCLRPELVTVEQQQRWARAPGPYGLSGWLEQPLREPCCPANWKLRAQAREEAPAGQAQAGALVAPPPRLFPSASEQQPTLKDKDKGTGCLWDLDRGKVRCGWWCQCCGRRKSSPTLVPSWARRGGGFQNHMGPTLQLWSPTRATWLPEPLSLMESKYPKHRVPRLSDHTQLCAAPSMVIPGHISRQQASVHTWTCLQNLCLLLVLFYHSRTVSSSLWPLAPLELIRSTTFLTFCIPDFREVSWSPPVLPFLSKDPNGWPAYFRCSKSVLHPIPALSPEPASSKDFSSPPPQPLLKCPLCVNMLFPGQHSQVSQHQRCLLKCSLCLFYNFSFKINLRVRNTAACYLESQFYVPHTFFLSSHALTD